MELADLGKEERVALAGLLEYVILASGHVTEDEQREIDQIVDAFGEDSYQASIDEVDRRFVDEEALRSFLKTIDRVEARELIFGVIMDAAMADMEGRDSSLLDWLVKEWDLEVRIDEPAPGDTKEEE